MTLWVVDTSPLLFLAKLGYLNLLRQGADSVYIPQAVWEEVCVKPDAAYAQIERATSSWLQVVTVTNTEASDFVFFHPH